jgi:hypothetical protein
MAEVEMVSLYDYLGHAAGTDLGARVYQASIRLKEQVETRQVSTKTYTGKVMLYRKQFLKEYFQSQQL